MKKQGSEQKEEENAQNKVKGGQNTRAKRGKKGLSKVKKRGGKLRKNGAAKKKE